MNGMASNVSNCCFSCCKGLCCNCCGKSCDMIAVCKNFSMVGTVDKLIQDGKIPPWCVADGCGRRLSFKALRSAQVLEFGPQLWVCHAAESDALHIHRRAPNSPRWRMGPQLTLSL